MPSLRQRIVERAKALPEAAPLRAGDFRAFGEAPRHPPGVGAPCARRTPVSRMPRRVHASG